VQSPAKDIHITPGIKENSLISTSKMSDAGYITVFNKDTVKIYNAHNTQVIVTRDAVINCWREDKTGMW
jgi:outer membrane lipoprotein-sorting protein